MPERKKLRLFTAVPHVDPLNETSLSRSTVWPHLNATASFYRQTFTRLIGADDGVCLYICISFHRAHAEDVFKMPLFLLAQIDPFFFFSSRDPARRITSAVFIHLSVLQFSVQVRSDRLDVICVELLGIILPKCTKPPIYTQKKWRRLED